MNRDRAFTLVLAVCCLLVLATLSASLNSTVSTNPDDAIDLDYGSLPLTVQDAAELRETYETGQPETEGETDGTRQSNPENRNPSDSDSTDSGSADANAGSEGDADRAGGVDSAADSSTEPDERDQGLLAMLQRLLAALLRLAPALMLLAAAIVATHQRNRLLAWLEAHLSRQSSTSAGIHRAASTPEVHPPSNQVERAWLEMLAESGVDPDPSATPRECAEAVVRAGLDSDAVWELTALFEEVRYDDTSVTSEEVQRAQTCLRRSTEQKVVE
jgi:hypothetical protein